MDMRNLAIGLMALTLSGCNDPTGIITPTPSPSPAASPSPEPSPSPKTLVLSATVEVIKEQDADSIAAAECKKGTLCSGGGCECQTGKSVSAQIVVADGVVCECSSGIATARATCMTVEQGKVNTLAISLGSSEEESVRDIQERRKADRGR
jgi:hypothetical protein